MAQDDYNINVKDTHRADKKRKSQKKKSKEKGAAKKKLKFFEKNVQDVNIDVVKCDVSMSKFCFTLLDTMGYIQEVTITKDAVSCTGPSCSGFCSHSTWCLHKNFHFSKDFTFTCTSANVIYCITCTYCNKLAIHRRTGRPLGDRFREHLRDVERNDKDAFKPDT